MNIRKLTVNDLSRIAEIFIFNNRINYFPIFKDEHYSFGELQVVSFVDYWKQNKEIMDNVYVYDDGIVKGFIEIHDTEIYKLYVDPFFQNNLIGKALITFAIENYKVNYLWALEKNTKAISFYQKYGFHITKYRKFEEDTTEYLIKLER